MNGLFSPESSFFKYGSLLADMVILSLMWLLFAIPVVTIGAGTSALFYAATKRISEREGYVSSDFWHAFKANFKRATLVWLVQLLVIALLVFNVLFVLSVEEVSGLMMFMLPAQLVLVVGWLLTSTYISPLIARFDMGFAQIFKSAFYMGMRHLLTSIGCVALLVSMFVIFWDFGFYPILLIGPGIYAWLASVMIMRVFRKYRPEMDQDPQAEIAEAEAKRAEEKRRRDVGITTAQVEEANAEVTEKAPLPDNEN